MSLVFLLSLRTLKLLIRRPKFVMGSFEVIVDSIRFKSRSIYKVDGKVASALRIPLPVLFHTPPKALEEVLDQEFLYRFIKVCL